MSINNWILIATCVVPAIPVAGAPALSQRVISVAGFEQCCMMSPKTKSVQNNDGSYIAEAPFKSDGTPFVKSRITYTPKSKRMSRLVLSSDPDKQMTIDDAIKTANRIIDWTRKSTGSKASFSELIVPSRTTGWQLQPMAKCTLPQGSKQMISLEWCAKDLSDTVTTKLGSKRKLPVAKGKFEFYLFYEDYYVKECEDKPLGFAVEFTGMFGVKFDEISSVPSPEKISDRRSMFTPVKRFREFNNYAVTYSAGGKSICVIEAQYVGKNRNDAKSEMLLVCSLLERKYGMRLKDSNHADYEVCKVLHFPNNAGIVLGRKGLVIELKAVALSALQELLKESTKDDIDAL